jgi:outer membrane protein assembly factor BamB
MSNFAIRNIVTATGLALILSGCSSLSSVGTSVSNLFADEDELEIRALSPIESKVAVNVAWQTQVGTGTGEFFSGLQPAFADNKIFVADRQGKVVALDTAGKELWSTRLGGSAGWFSSGISAKLSGGLNVGAGKVFVGTEDGRLVGLNSETGAIEFDTNVVGEILARPMIDSGMVFVNTSAGRLFALDIATGEQVWMHESDVPPLSLRGISTPTVTNGGVLVGTGTGKLQVNIMETGLIAWEATVTTPSGATELERIIDVDSQPILNNGIVYVVSFNGSLAAVELRSGRVVWQREYASYRDLALIGTKLVVTTNNGNVFGIDSRNGVELWSQSSLKGRALTAPSAYKGKVVVGDKFGAVHVIDINEGALLGRAMLNDKEDAKFNAPAVVAGEQIIMQNALGKVYALTIQ